MKRRTARWVAVALAAATGVSLFAVGTGSARQPKAKQAQARTIAVIGVDFRFRLPGARTGTTGTTVFKFTNKGRTAHDFKIAGKKTPVIGPGKSATLRVRFTRPGNYPFICTVAGHAAAGMKGTFKVARP